MMKKKGGNPNAVPNADPSMPLRRRMESRSTAKKPASTQSLRPDPILGTILHLKRRRHPLARLGRLPARRVQPVHLLQHLPRGILRIELQPRHRPKPLPVSPERGIRRRGGAVGFFELARAVLMQRRVEVEEGRRGVEEEVVAGDVLVGRAAVVAVRGRDGEVEGDGGESGEEGRGVGCEAGDVEEGCFGADGEGDGGGVCDVAGVVLGAPADGYVGEGEAGCWGWEGGWCCGGR